MAPIFLQKNIKENNLLSYQNIYTMYIANMSGFTLAILRQTTILDILMEYGFMDYEKEIKLILDKKYQEKCSNFVNKN